MKNPKAVRRDWTLVLIILPFGILLMWLVGQLAIRLSPTWVYAADMRSYLDPNSSYVNQQDNGDVAPVLPEIMTPAYWEGTYLTPGATIPTRESSPTLQPTYTATPTATATEIPATPIFTPTPTVIYPTLTFTPTATPITYTLRVYITGTGSVEVSPNLTRYPAGSDVQLNANPSTGWTFAGWMGDLSGSANPAIIKMDADKTVRAIFTRNEYTLTINIIGGGTVIRDPNQATYYHNDQVDLTAIPDPGWVFAGWSGDLNGFANPASTMMTRDKIVTATFTQIEYSLTVNTIGNGSVTKNPNQATYNYGDVVQLTANAGTGWTFAGWSGDLGGSTNPASITINGNKIVTATFTQIEYTLTVNTVGNGSVSKNPNQATYHYGDVVQLTANPDPNWSFSGWSGNLGGSTNPSSITIDGNKTVTATFTQTECTLTVNIVGNGSVTKDPNLVTYPIGTSVVLTANASTGWPFTGWSGDLGGSTNPVTILMDGDKTITATFTAIEYTLTINISGNGTVTKNPNQATYHYGDVVQLTANPASGWAFSGWSGNLVGSTNPGFLTINGNQTVTATFINPEPDIGPPDGSLYPFNDGDIRVFDLGGSIDVTGDPADLGRYDLVYYEYWVPLTNEIYMDWVILQISTDGNSWYTIFYWGDGIPDNHSNVSAYTENDNEPIPLSSLYGTLPYKTGIAIDVDGAPGVSVPGILTNTVAGPVPAGSYRYLRVYSPPGGATDGGQVDSLQILP